MADQKWSAIKIYGDCMSNEWVEEVFVPEPEKVISEEYNGVIDLRKVHVEIRERGNNKIHALSSMVVLTDSYHGYGASGKIEAHRGLNCFFVRDVLAYLMRETGEFNPHTTRVTLNITLDSKGCSKKCKNGLFFLPDKTLKCQCLTFKVTR